MRIYSNAYQLMSETGRNLIEMGCINRPKSYQNKIIEGDENFITKELICEQYCLTSMDSEEALFAFDPNSKPWVESEIKERLDNTKSINPGEAWKIRPDLWEQFLNQKGEFDYTYNHRIWYNNNLQIIIDELKRNPDTRQAILPIFNTNDPSFIGGLGRIPCSVYYNFLIRENVQGERQVNICYHQRSSDFVTHFGNDVWLAWKLMEYVAEQVGVKPGYLYHTIDSLHTYKKDWDTLKTPINEYLTKNNG